jgi:hypothetical protein
VAPAEFSGAGDAGIELTYSDMLTKEPQKD